MRRQHTDVARRRWQEPGNDSKEVQRCPRASAPLSFKPSRTRTNAEQKNLETGDYRRLGGYRCTCRLWSSWCGGT